MSKVPDFSSESWTTRYVKLVRDDLFDRENESSLKERLECIENVEGSINELHELGYSMLTCAIDKKLKEDVFLMLKNPEIDINKTGISDSTPLMFATAYDQPDITKALCERPELLVNKINDIDYSALRYGIKFERIVKILLTRDEIDLANGRKSIDSAPDSVKLLIEERTEKD
eukprot:TRINITY_DN871_c6_g1_i1.p1 TRINITY_DN871_c6_g1~~TRINITY_DN871_c6_g1_i1.p1  ORF type:complete len:173 (-),score=37.24 TRINITY_DN871_c6_g1_i1:933-1451(-)